MNDAEPSTPSSLADVGEANDSIGKLHDALTLFLHHVKAGHDVSLNIELAAFTMTMMEALDAVASARPDTLQALACDSVVWPVLACRHRPQGHDFAALADRIGLGSNVVVSISPRATYRTDTPLNRFLFQVLLARCLDTPKQFYFLKFPKDQPKLTHRSLPWYLDGYLMPMLDGLREEQGSWDGVPALAALVAGVASVAQQQRIARQHLRAALLEMAGPKKEAA